MLLLGLCILVASVCVGIYLDKNFAETAIYIGSYIPHFYKVILISCGVLCFVICLVGELILTQLKFKNEQPKEE